MDEERTLWKGHPSPKKDLGFYVVCTLLSPLILPLVAMLVRYLNTKFYKIEVTSERIRITTGILSKRMDELELYRVKDTRVEEPFFLRLFGLGNIVIATSDQSHPALTLEAIPETRALREDLRGCVEKLRDRKRVREIDYA